MKGKELINSLIEDVNRLKGFDFIKLSTSNGYCCIRKVKTNEDISPDSCLTLKENIIFVRGLKKGILEGRFNYGDRVFLVIDSRGNANFCTLERLNFICEDLNEGYFNIYHFWNNKQKKITKKDLNLLFESAAIKKTFFY